MAAINGFRTKRKSKRSGSTHRTGAPIRRDSIEEGTFEEAFFRRPGKGETDRIYKEAKALSARRSNLRAQIAHEEREPTREEAAILRFNRNVLAVLEALLEIARVQAGKVYPTYEYLADKVGIGRKTVAHALSILTEIGFVVSQRRFKRVEVEGVGPRYKQTSNAYRMMSPKGIAAFLPRWMKPAPLPADEIQRQADRVEDIKAMLSTLTRREYAQAMVSGPLGKALASYGGSLDRAAESECHLGTQPHPNINLIRSERLGLVGQGVTA